MALVLGGAPAPPLAQNWHTYGADMALAEPQEPYQPAVQVRSLEEEYGEIVAHLLADQVHAQEAVQALEGVCKARAEQLRREMVEAGQQQGMRKIHLEALAKEFEAQAATWHLVSCLFTGLGKMPTGVGGPEIERGRLTSSQVISDKVQEDERLLKCAQVIQWLESLSQDAIEATSGHAANRLGKTEGVWTETKTRVGTAGYVSELDPDAPGREKKSLHRDNASSEERLLGRCWELVRAGKYTEAEELLRNCGQPWRAASLRGPTGGWGPVPVGLQAEERDEAYRNNPLQIEELALETELGGPATARAQWKLSCLQVAQQAAEAATPGGKSEAALYGLFAGHLPSVLPVCVSWRDQCWAHCRAWLDREVDDTLSKRQESLALPKLPILTNNDALLSEEIAKWSVKGSAHASALTHAALAALAGDAVAALRLDGGSAAPTSFDAIFNALSSSESAHVQAEARDPLCVAQQLMIQGDMVRLTDHLFSWLDSPFRSTDPLAAADTDIYGMDTDIGVGEGSVALGLPPARTRQLAFGCHLLIALEALGVLRLGTDRLARQQLAIGREKVLTLYVGDLTDRRHIPLVPQYLCLVGPGNRERLSQEALTLITRELLAGADTQGNNTDVPVTGVNPQGDALGLQFYTSLSHWCGVCEARQRRQEERRHERELLGPEAVIGKEELHAIETDIRHEETRRLLACFVDTVRLASAAHLTNNPTALTSMVGGATSVTANVTRGMVTGAASVSKCDIAVQLGRSSLGRVTAARWLLYPYMAHVMEQQGRTGRGGGEGGMEDGMEGVSTLAGGEDALWVDGLSYVVSLCSELSLGGGEALAAGLHLLDEVVPKGFTEAAMAQLDMTRARVGQCQARAVMSQDPLDAQEAQRDAYVMGHWAQQMSEVLQAVRCWRLYFRNAVGEAKWRADMAAYSAAGPGPAGDAERVTLVQKGRRLIEQVTEQVAENDTLAAQQGYDAGGVGAGESGGVDGAEACTQAAAYPPTMTQYPVMKGVPLVSLEQAVTQALEKASLNLLASSAAGLSTSNTDSERIQFEVTCPASAQGCLSVTLIGSAAQPQDLLHLSWGLIQGSLPGLKLPLTLVNVAGPQPYIHALCMHCCLARAILMCARTRRLLAEIGDDGTAGNDLYVTLTSRDLKPDVAPGGKLTHVLSRAQIAWLGVNECQIRTVLHKQTQQPRGF